MFLDTMWTWDGAVWQRLDTSPKPPAEDRPGSQFAGDASRETLVLAREDDTWLYGDFLIKEEPVAGKLPGGLQVSYEAVLGRDGSVISGTYETVPVDRGAFEIHR